MALFGTKLSSIPPWLFQLTKQSDFVESVRRWHITIVDIPPSMMMDGHQNLGIQRRSRGELISYLSVRAITASRHVAHRTLVEFAAAVPDAADLDLAEKRTASLASLPFQA